MKWSRMLRNWDRSLRSEKFILRIFKGIPDSLRSKVWRKLLMVDALKHKHDTEHSVVGYYAFIRDKARKESVDIRQIDLDVNRTFRENVYFRERYNFRQQMLFHVLITYSVFNRNLGYCQGMNNIAALLVMYFEAEEDAFWGLTQLMSAPQYSLERFFLRNFPKFGEFEQSFNTILRRLLPKVKRRLDTLAVSSTMYLFKWLINCYIDALPFSLTLRVWDVFLARGDHVLLAMAYNIMRIHEKRILQMRSIDRFLEFISTHLSASFCGVKEDITIQKLQRALSKLRRHKLLPDTARPQTPSTITALATVTLRNANAFVANNNKLKTNSRGDDFSNNNNDDDDSSTEMFIDDDMSRDTSVVGLHAFGGSEISLNGDLGIGEDQKRITSIVSTSFTEDIPIGNTISRSSSIYDNVSRLSVEAGSKITLENGYFVNPLRTSLASSEKKLGRGIGAAAAVVDDKKSGGSNPSSNDGLKYHRF
ncbi:hypothetical protein ACOME3_009995 [Neoechinorhynchus agilis]